MGTTCRLRVIQTTVLFLCGVACLCHPSAEAIVGDRIQVSISVSKETFLEAEPLPVRARIRNRSRDFVEVISNLEPEYLVLRFRVRDPEGEIWIADPLVCVSIEGYEKIALSAGDELIYSAPLLFGVVRGVAKFLFDKTGNYTMEALYDAEGTGKPFSSKPVTITVVEANECLSVVVVSH